MFCFAPVFRVKLETVLRTIKGRDTNWLLPPASEGWGKVPFSVCLSVHTSRSGRGGGGGFPGPGRGVPHPRSRQGGYTIPGLDRGVLHKTDRGYPYPIPGPGRGYPIQLIGEYPIPDMDGGVKPPPPPPARTGLAPIR